MPSIVCNIDGKDYQLEYDSNPDKDGINFWGTLFASRNLSFSFIVKPGAEICFHPRSTEPLKRQAIVAAVNSYEKVIEN